MAAVPINYVRGDAVYPEGPGNKIIVHICNDVGHWGGDFTWKLTERWHKPQMAYQHHHMLNDTDELLELGTTQFVKVEHDVWVANLIGQHGTGNRSIVPPIRHDAVHSGLDRVARKALQINASVHMPRIGCGLAGDPWERMEQIIRQTLINRYVEVTVYDLRMDDLPVDDLPVAEFA
jgi:O-acetyl-ADP-ribose deacetylase (regulator of RNase III)